MIRPNAIVILLTCAIGLAGCADRTGSQLRGVRPRAERPITTVETASSPDLPAHGEIVPPPRIDAFPPVPESSRRTPDSVVPSEPAEPTEVIPSLPTPTAPVVPSAPTNSTGVDGSRPATEAASAKLPSEIEETPLAEKDLPPDLPTEDLSTEPRPVRVTGNYEVRPGDELDILFRQSWDQGSDYRLMPGDQIRMEILLQGSGPGRSEPTLDRSTRIQPDGKITLPYLGLVDASGRTVVELAKRLSDGYSEYYVEPEVLVSLVSSGEGLHELREALRSAGSRSTLVAPDGKVTLPYLGAVKAAGLRVSEIEAEINERYRRALPGIATTVRLAGSR